MSREEKTPSYRVGGVGAFIGELLSEIEAGIKLGNKRVGYPICPTLEGTKVKMELKARVAFRRREGVPLEQIILLFDPYTNRDERYWPQKAHTIAIELTLGGDTEQGAGA